MSNARSPREVCSTTIGTSGLMVLALVSLRRPDSSTRRLAGRPLIGWRPQTSWRERGRRLLGGGLGGPQALARLRLGDRDGGGAGGDQLDRLAGGDVLAHLLQAPGRAQLLEALRGLHPLVLGRE